MVRSLLYGPPGCGKSSLIGASFHGCIVHGKALYVAFSQRKCYGFWWIILLPTYTKSTEDNSLADNAACQEGTLLILNVCL